MKAYRNTPKEKALFFVKILKFEFLRDIAVRVIEELEKLEGIISQGVLMDLVMSNMPYIPCSKGKAPDGIGDYTEEQWTSVITYYLLDVGYLVRDAGTAPRIYEDYTRRNTGDSWGNLFYKKINDTTQSKN